MRDEFVPVESSSALQGLFAPIARRWRMVVVLLVVTLSLAGLAAWFAPPEYISEMTIVVRRDRVDPVVTSDPNSDKAPMPVEEADLLSEAEILRSRDLLEAVVLEAGLHTPDRYDDPVAEARARARAVNQLSRDLDVTPVRRTTMIRVRYAAPDAATAQRVLQTLSDRYLDKHLAVHRASGTAEFFGEQVERSRQELAEAQARLAALSQEQQVVLPEEERMATLQQLAAFESTLQQARAEAADVDRRLEAIQRELAVTPARQVTAVRTGTNSTLVGQLKARILEMELEREELLRKFTPAYPPVQQLEAQLQHARESLAAAEAAPILDETTDQNPTYQWLRSEEARVRAERAALTGRVASLERTVAEFRARARRLDVQAIEQQNLVRAVAAAEEAYRLYQRKYEEARIADALDQTRIANVGVVDPPSRPANQSNQSRALILWLGVVASLLLSAGTAVVVDRLHPVVYSPSDVQGALRAPVLATVPAQAD